jgi:ubiquinone/menaquinone biosynthesis C-methylase UbiE
MAKAGRREPEELVKEWYSKSAKGEWRRLQRDPYHQIEHLVTMHFLQKYLPKRGLVLDAGGGPGRYTIDLAKAGHNVVLLDLAHEMLKLAQRKAKRVGVTRNIKEFLQGSVENHSRFQDGTFDAVMCLGGPLSHLLSQQQRETGTKELVRVAKKEAPIFVSVISRVGLLKSILTCFPHEMCYAKHHWEVGDYIPGLHAQGFTATHWFLPEELQGLFEKQNVQVLEMAGLEGLSSHHVKETNKLYKDQEKWRMGMEIILKTCTHPSVVGNTEHFLLVAKKKG